MRRWGKDESHSEVLAQNPGSGGRGPWKFQRQDKALYREVHVDPWAFLLCAVGGLGPSSPRGRRDHLRLSSKEEGGHTHVTRDGHTQAIHRPSGRSEPASALIIYIMVPGGLRGHPPRGLRLPPPPFGHFAWWPGAVPSLPPSLPTLSTKPFLPSPSPPAAG